MTGLRSASRRTSRRPAARPRCARWGRRRWAGRRSRRLRRARTTRGPTPAAGRSAHRGPRTADPRGRVHRTPVLSGGSPVVCCGSVRVVPPYPCVQDGGSSTLRTQPEVRGAVAGHDGVAAGDDVRVGHEHLPQSPLVRVTVTWPTVTRLVEQRAEVGAVARAAGRRPAALATTPRSSTVRRSLSLARSVAADRSSRSAAKRADVAAGAPAGCRAPCLPSWISLRRLRQRLGGRPGERVAGVDAAAAGRCRRRRTACPARRRSVLRSSPVDRP